MFINVRRYMRFSHKDKKDIRVIRQSTYAFDYPLAINKAPKEQGVFVLLNESSDVLYVGYVQANYFESTLSRLIDNPVTNQVVAFRWFVTDCEKTAGLLAQDWIIKYQPKNQDL